MTDQTTRVIHVRDMPSYPDAIYVGRSVPRKRLNAHPLANPYKIGVHGTRDEVIRRYAAYLDALLTGTSRQRTLAHLDEIAGRPLVCWCRRAGEPRTPETACHADILITVMEREGVQHD